MGQQHGTHIARRGRVPAVIGAAGVAALAMTISTAGAVAAPAVAAAAPAAGAWSGTTTPIKHVIVIIGENHSFDNIFATYQPPSGNHIQNLLSEGIITKNGGLGPNWRKAQQLTAVNTKAY